MDKKLFTLEEAKDKILGKIGTERRDNYESELAQELNRDTCDCKIPYFPTGDKEWCSKCDKPTVY